MTRSDFVKRIVAERDRQFNLPGREFDMRNLPNDWIALICKYASRDTGSLHTAPSRIDFEDDLIKAGAIILAALEHIEVMVAHKLLVEFRDPTKKPGQLPPPLGGGLKG
jgi:hypothetical protein